MSRVYAFVAVLAAAGLAVPALAAINYNAGKSNTGSLTFEANCKSQHGTVVATPGGGSSCKLAVNGMNEPHWSPPPALMSACTKDGGKPTANKGTVVCDHPTGMSAGKRTH